MFFSSKQNFHQKGEQSVVQTLMVALLIIAAFLIGMLWTKVQTMEGKDSAGKNNAVVANDTAPAKEKSAGKLEAVSKEDWVRGNRNARFAMVEYSDLECPFCKRFQETGIQMAQEYGDKVMWVYRHFPLDQLHSKARNEANASECAGKLGGNDKFWAYIDAIYKATPGNNGLDPQKLFDTAAQLGLNAPAFKSCVDKNEGKDLVEADFQSGVTAGIQGTPGVILLDTKTGKTSVLPGAVPFTTLKQNIDAFMAGADK
jgi:protein-disulfide isomerase